MAARRWTAEQKARQAELIHTWKPWQQSTGPTTEAGKKASSRNAFRCALREVMRELTRSNREVLAYIKGMAPAPDWPATTVRMDALMSELASAPTPSPRNAKQRRSAGQCDTTAGAPVSNPMVSTQVATENRVSEPEVSTPVAAIEGR